MPDCVLKLPCHQTKQEMPGVIAQRLDIRVAPKRGIEVRVAAIKSAAVTRTHRVPSPARHRSVRAPSLAAGVSTPLALSRWTWRVDTFRLSVNSGVESNCPALGASADVTAGEGACRAGVVRPRPLVGAVEFCLEGAESIGQHVRRPMERGPRGGHGASRAARAAALGGELLGLGS